MWTNQAEHLILASASPRRRQLLEQIQVPIKPLILPVNGEDEPRLADESVVDYVARTARDKLDRASAYCIGQAGGLEKLPILAADTTVAIGERILGKPVDVLDAKRILIELAGQTHDVYTAVAMVYRDEVKTTLTRTQVHIDAALINVVDTYIKTGEPFGKAGAYAIQGAAAAYVTRIEGSYTGVVGLPLYETVQLLSHMGLFE